MNDRFITIHSRTPNVHFENPLDLDRLLRTVECVQAMRLERLYGVPFKVKATFVPKEVSVNAKH